MLFNTICWILIGVCCFYLIRNIYVGSIMFPFGKRILKIYNDMQKHFYLFITPNLRNYYLVVLNPFLWKPLDIYANDKDGLKIKILWKTFCDEQKNLRKL